MPSFIICLFTNCILIINKYGRENRTDSIGLKMGLMDALTTCYIYVNN